MQTEFEHQYNEERSLFETGCPRFQGQGWLGACDFFSIIRPILCSTIAPIAVTAQQTSADPFIWLEDVDGNLP